MLLKKNTIACALIGASLFTLPVLAHAGLKITNNTAQDSTTIINNTCSTAIGPKGVTHPHSTNEVSDLAIRMVCLASPNNCVADVRMTSNCSGDSVATVVYDINSGVKSAKLTAAGERAGYRISTAGYSIQFDGGPTFYSAK